MYEFNQWEELIFSIEEGKCILFLGPGLVTSKRNSNIPVTNLLSNYLYKKLPDKSQIPDKYNLPHVADIYQNFFGKRSLKIETVNFYKSVNGSLNYSNLINLMEIPFQLIIYSTQENVVELLLTRENRQNYKGGFYNFSGNVIETSMPKESNETYIYQLFGSINSPSSIVLSESDRVKFLRSIINPNPGLPDWLKSEFKNSEQSFLFLGFGFDKWYLRILLDVIREDNHKENRSYALEQIDQFDQSNFRETIAFFQTNHRIYLYQHKISKFVDLLLKTYKKTIADHKTSSKHKVQYFPGEPKVFLCYDRRNKDKVQEIYDYLVSQHFNVWMDKYNVLAGAKFSEVAKESILKVDYFLVLQSKEMMEKLEGYCYEEIDTALTRQKRMKPGTIFIIPTRIDDCENLPIFNDFHCHDLKYMKDYEELVKHIKRDFERRKKGKL